MLRAIAICAFLVATAHADSDVNGFVAYGAGPLTGHLAEANGAPLAGVEIHAVSKAGERVVKTDKNGNYRIELPGGSSIVFVRDHPNVQLVGETAQTVAADTGGETIAVRAFVPPAVMPSPHVSPTRIPEYSDAAIDKNAWTKAWLLLDVDETGAVRHVKFLKRPGFDLDPIAMRAAFKLTFDPALDRAHHPVRALLVWSFEWPSYYWLQALHESGRELPGLVDAVPCQKAGEHHAEFRDCAGPDFGHAMIESWITPRPAK